MNIRIKLLVMDVDGTLTDGKIYMGKSGELMKAFNIRDGYGIRDLLHANCITPVIITGRKSEIVTNRAKELGITEVHQGVENKLTTLNEILERRRETQQHVAYIGDDLNDMICMKTIKEAGGLIACPSDADKKLREYCDYVCAVNGGDGAVREFIDYIIKT